MKRRENNKQGERIIAAVLACFALAAGSCRAASAASTTLVVNEIEHSEAGNTSREFVEVRNVSADDIHADLYTLEWRSAGNATITKFYTFPAGTIVPANGYYLVVSASYAAYHTDVPYNGSYPVSTGGVLNSNGGVGIRDARGALIDSVAWGNITASPHPFVETAAALAPGAGASIERVTGLDGLVDHDDNLTDFAVTAAPTPQTTLYTPNVPVVSAATAVPDHVDRGGSMQITATVTATANPVTGVAADLTPFGGAADAPLTNSGGNTWTAAVPVPVDQTAGPFTLLIKATDTAGKFGAGGASVFVYPGPPITITELRSKTPNTGELLRVRGLVLSARTGKAYLIDGATGRTVGVTDGGALDGVAPVRAGDDVTITGTLAIAPWYNSTTGALIFPDELTLTTATGTAADIVVNSAKNALPAPRPVSVDDVTADDALQGEYVSVSGVTMLGTGQKVSATGEGVFVASAATNGSLFGIAVSRNATDQAMTPYPGVSNAPIPGSIVSGNFVMPWIAAGDTFDVRGVVSGASIGLWTRVIRVESADDFVLTNNAKFLNGTAAPAAVEQGASVTLRVFGYPERTAAVSANLGALGGGAVALTDDGAGYYSATVPVPASTPVGAVSIPVSVTSAGQTAAGSVEFSVIAPIARPGDFDRSGAVDMADVRLALKAAAGLLSTSDPAVNFANGDVSPKGKPDGQITLDDALRILRAVQGLDTL